MDLTNTLVISNSPSIRAGHYGKQVDAHTNVVRFNRGFVGNDCPDAIGSKTDTLAMCGCCAMRDDDTLLRAVLDPRWQHVQTLLCTWYTLRRQDCVKRLQAISEHKRVIRLDFGFCRRIEAEAGIHNATSGLLVIAYYLEQLGSVTTLGFYGDPDQDAPQRDKRARERDWIHRQPGVHFLETMTPEATP